MNSLDEILGFLILRQMVHIVACRPVAKQWLRKQRPLLGNARNNRTTGLCNPFLSISSVNTPTTMGILLETVFSVGSVQSCEEEFSWDSAVELRSSKSAVIRELGSARETEKMTLPVQMCSVNQRAAAWPPKLKYLHCVKSVARKRLMETVNRLRTLVCMCQWIVKCSSEWCMQVVNKPIQQSVPRL
jgi:hypothetical protein